MKFLFPNLVSICLFILFIFKEPEKPKEQPKEQPKPEPMEVETSNEKKQAEEDIVKRSVLE